MERCLVLFFDDTDLTIDIQSEQLYSAFDPNSRTMKHLINKVHSAALSSRFIKIIISCFVDGLPNNVQYFHIEIESIDFVACSMMMLWCRHLKASEWKPGKWKENL